MNEFGQSLESRRQPDSTYRTVVAGPFRESVVPVGSADGSIVFNPITVTNEGRVVGTQIDVTTGEQTATTWTRRHGVTAIEAPSGGSTFAVNGNDRGQVVGGYLDVDGEARAFIWSDGTFTDLGTLGGYTTVVAGGITIPSDFANQAMNRQGLNRRGQVIGTSYDAEGWKRGFIWQNGTMTDLGDLPGGCGQVTPRSLNDRGQVVGTCDNGTGSRAFLWESGEMRELGSILDVGYPVGINDRGHILSMTFGDGRIIARIVTVHRRPDRGAEVRGAPGGRPRATSVPSRPIRDAGAPVGATTVPAGGLGRRRARYRGYPRTSGRPTLRRRPRVGAPLALYGGVLVVLTW